MSEVWRIVLTASVTVAGGVIVYFLGHLFVSLFVEPIHRLRTLIGETADSLVFYANLYSNPGYGGKEDMDEASEVLRRRASQLRARAHSIPWYSLWSIMKLVRKRAEIEEASGELIAISNSIHRSDPNLGIENHRRREKIEELLGIRSSEKPKQVQKINGVMLSHGIMLFFFGIILLGFQGGELVLFGFDIPTFPIEFYRALGIIAVLASLLFIVAQFCKQLATRIEKFLEERPRSRWQGVIKWLFWVIFWLVYVVGWLKGLSSIPGESFAFSLVFYIGFVWFLIIGIVFLRASWQSRKR